MRKRIVTDPNIKERDKFYRNLLKEYKQISKLEGSGTKDISHIKAEIEYNNPRYFIGIKPFVIPSEKTLLQMGTSKKVIKRVYGSKLSKIAALYSPKEKTVVIPYGRLTEPSEVGILSHELRHHAQHLGMVRKRKKSNLPLSFITKPIIKGLYWLLGYDKKGRQAEIDAIEHQVAIVRKLRKKGWHK